MAWSRVSSAGGSCTQRAVQVGMVSMRGTHSSAILAAAVERLRIGVRVTGHRDHEVRAGRP